MCGSRLHLEKERKQPFSWLTCTNAGASEVCAAALRLIGITQQELDQGYLCDPTTKSNLRMVAKPGVIIRLSRNFDKQRGFVNDALAEICESLRGNEVFTARLIGSGNMVLVHPTTKKAKGFCLVATGMPPPFVVRRELTCFMVQSTLSRRNFQLLEVMLM